MQSVSYSWILVPPDFFFVFWRVSRCFLCCVGELELVATCAVSSARAVKWSDQSHANNRVDNDPGRGATDLQKSCARWSRRSALFDLVAPCLRSPRRAHCLPTWSLTLGSEIRSPNAARRPPWSHLRRHRWNAFFHAFRPLSIVNQRVWEFPFASSKRGSSWNCIVPVAAQRLSRWSWIICIILLSRDLFTVPIREDLPVTVPFHFQWSPSHNIFAYYFLRERFHGNNHSFEHSFDNTEAILVGDLLHMSAKSTSATRDH